MLLAFASSAWAQTDDLFDPYMLEPLPAGAPAWMESISNDPSGVNFRDMEAHFREWLAKDPDARAKTLEKKPAVNYYRRWHSAYERYVGDDGLIHLPTMEQHIKNLNENLNAHAIMAKEDVSAMPSWQNIGPYDTYKNGKPYDSHACVFRLTVCTSNPNVLYAGTEMGVVFKTTDKGLTWQPCAPLHNFGGSIYAIQVDPRNPDIVFCGGGVNLWKSTDGGASWAMQTSVTGNVNSIRFSPDDSNYITFATGLSRGTKGGFYVTTDGGQTYQRTFTGLCYDHELKPGNPRRIYMFGQEGYDVQLRLRISDDGGLTFRTVEMGGVTDIVAGRLAVSQAPGGEDYVYAIANTYYIDMDRGPIGGMGTPHLLKSTDSGETWTDKTQCFEGNHMNCTFSGFGDTNGGQGFFDMIIGVSAENPEHVIYGLTCCYRDETGGDGLALKTSIGGYTNRDNMHPDMQDIVVCGGDTWISTDGGIRYSADFFKTPGEIRHHGIYAAQFVGYGLGWNKDVMAGGRWHNGDAVMAENFGLGNSIHVGGVESPTGYVMLSNSHRVYFSDGSMYTIPEGSIDDPVVSESGFFPYNRRPAESVDTSNEIDFDPRYAKRLIIVPAIGSDYDDIHRLYMSEDEGKSFRMIFDCDESYVQSHTHARSNPDHLYAVTQYSIYHSTDNGDNWDDFANKPFADGRTQSGASIAVDPHHDNILWYANGSNTGQVAYTEDYGQTWIYPLQGTKYEKKKMAWIVLTGYKNGVYLSTNIGDNSGQMVIYRDDDTDGWVEYTNGLPSAAVIARLTPFYKEGKLRAATYQGIWEVPLYHEHFVPVAQPMALNLGHGNLTGDPLKVVEFDSYSIVNQEDAQWEWSFTPEPYKVEGADTRNPKVVFGRKGEYDVTLKVTTPEGSHSRTIPAMIRLDESAPGLDDITTAIATSRTPQVDFTVSYTGGTPTLIINSSRLTTDKTLRLHNLKGATLRSVHIPASESRTEVSLGQLAAGNYVYSLSAKGYKYYGKILIQK